jgi:GNAT superfamily N-acetyltransferase
VLSVLDLDTEVLRSEWLPRALEVHRELRPQLPGDVDGYVGKMARVFAGGGTMVIATRAGIVEGLAVSGGDFDFIPKYGWLNRGVCLQVYRVVENTFRGRFLYVDDLVTRESSRSGGVGSAIMTRVEARARGEDCAVMALDSGVQRAQAHKFYFARKFTISCFHFSKPLQEG